jgi:hypothetical protein
MTKVSLVIQSMLNDAMVEAQCLQSPELMDMAQERLRFVKYLITMFPDTTKKIDEIDVYHMFKIGEITAKPL